LPSLAEPWWDPRSYLAKPRLSAFIAAGFYAAHSSFIHAFEMLDINKDGYIPLVDLRHVLMKEGDMPLSEQEVDELLMFADLEGDGLIEYKSFLRWLSNPDAPQNPRL